MVFRRDIIYPWVLNCCKFCSDSYWENIFEDLAYGHPPYGTYISRDFLCCNYKKRDFSYKIEDKDPLKLYNDIYNLLKNRLGLLSRQDKAQKQLDFQSTEETLKNARKNWSDIRKKNTKDLLIEQYVIRMKQKNKLNLKQTRFLYSIISIAIVFKVITSSDIEYDNGIINNIKCIDFHNKKVIITKDLYSTSVGFLPEIVIDKKVMAEQWDKYLKELRKIIDQSEAK